MEKRAPSSHPIHDLIARRWSPVGLEPKPIEPVKLAQLLEAARWAPSSYNEQPWTFLVAPREDAAGFAKLLGCIVEGNLPWAKNAGVLMLSVAKLTFARNGKPNRHAYHDVGMATENLVLQAVDLGLVGHQMAGFDVEKARRDCAIPEGFDPVTMIAIGTPAGSGVPSDLAGRDSGPRSRKPLSSMVSGATFGTALPLPAGT